VCFIFASKCWLHLLLERCASHYMHDRFGVCQPSIRITYLWSFYFMRFCTPLEWEESIFPQVFVFILQLFSKWWWNSSCFLPRSSFLGDFMGFLSDNNFKIQQKWWVVNIGFKLSNLRDLSKMVFFLSILKFSFWFYFEISMQDAPLFHLDINLGPCVHFNFFMSMEVLRFHLFNY